MNRSDLRDILAGLDLAGRATEEPFRRRMIELLDNVPGCFVRSTFPGHFTGSALVLNNDRTKALLHHHRKLDRWLQFGGHCDGDEDVCGVAQREAFEESGIAGLKVLAEAPSDLDIHEIPPHRDEPAHLHYDVRFLLAAGPDAAPAVSEESHQLGWFTIEEFRRQARDPGLLRMADKWQTSWMPK